MSVVIKNDSFLSLHIILLSSGIAVGAKEIIANHKNHENLRSILSEAKSLNIFVTLASSKNETE